MKSQALRNVLLATGLSLVMTGPIAAEVDPMGAYGGHPAQGAPDVYAPPSAPSGPSFDQPGQHQGETQPQNTQGGWEMIDSWGNLVNPWEEWPR